MARSLKDRTHAQAKFTHRLGVRYRRAKAHLNVLRRAQERSKDPVKRMLGYSAKFVGVTEKPAGSNWGGYVSQWLKRFHSGPNPWCGAFAGSMLAHVGVKVTDRVLYAPYIKEDAKRGRAGFKRWETDPKKWAPGWIGTLWNGEHIVVIVSIDYVNRIVHTREGNTSFADGSQSNGGCVANKTRKFTDFDGAAEPDYPKGS